MVKHFMASIIGLVVLMSPPHECVKQSPREPGAANARRHPRAP